jgi:hypothetical protein
MSLLMKANPGGQIAPNEVVGRNELIAHLWRVLERQSVILTAERRMGKTQVIKKMEAEAPPSKLLIYHDLEGVRTALEFVEIVFRDVEGFLSLKKRSAERAKSILAKLGGGEVGAVKFPELLAPHWKTLLTSTVQDLAENQEERQVIFLWDELPLMLHNVRQNQGEPAAMELLDTLRMLRQTYPGLRMVFTGSVGLHHVIYALKNAGHINPSTNDMKTVEVMPLSVADAEGLAAALLKGEGVQATDRNLIARMIATETDGVPYYIHHVVDDMAATQQAGTEDNIRKLVENRLRDPQDSWELQHYYDRVPRYYAEEDVPIAYAILDALADVGKEADVEALFKIVKARVKLRDLEAARRLLRLLQRDHYVVQTLEDKFQFRLNLIRRAWRIHRP